MALINDFMSLIYPRQCEACTAALFSHEPFICTHCQLNLPKSNYHCRSDSELDTTFAGRVPVVNAACYYLYEKSSRVQRLLHAIKYEDQKELGEYLGSLYGRDLAAQNAFGDIDTVIPVPLHRRKLRARGFNQSEWFAKGLAARLNKTLDTTALERVSNSLTQTRKRKFERWENVEGIFRLQPGVDLSNRHILLVDDVITTGATIEACWMALKHVPGIQISVVSIAFAAKR